MPTMFKNLDKFLVFFVLYTIVFFTLFGTLQYTLPFLLAGLFALMLRKPTKYLINKLKLNSSLSAVITTAISCVIIFWILISSSIYLISELKDLASNITYIINDNTSFFYEKFEELINTYHNLDPAIINTIEDNVMSQAQNISKTVIQISSNLGKSLLAMVSSIPTLIMIIFFTIFSTYFLTKDLVDKNNILDRATGNGGKGNKFNLLLKNIRSMLGRYILSYMFLVFFTFLENLVAFSILNVNYAFILALLCAFLDLLPIVGTIMIYAPLVIGYLVQGNYFVAIALIVIYLIILVIRQILEPKLLSKTLKMHPVATLASIFIGMKVNGFIGIVYFLMLIVFYNIFKESDII